MSFSLDRDRGPGMYHEHIVHIFFNIDSFLIQVKQSLLKCSLTKNAYKVKILLGYIPN